VVTGSLAGGLVAGLRFLVVGARANDGSLAPAITGEPFVSGLFASGLFASRLPFAFRLLPGPDPVVARRTSGAADRVWSDP
jgi:hypothetical protein